jgi:hypothetical protein
MSRLLRGGLRHLVLNDRVEGPDIDEFDMPKLWELVANVWIGALWAVRTARRKYGGFGVEGRQGQATNVRVGVSLLSCSHPVCVVGTLGQGRPNKLTVTAQCRYLTIVDSWIPLSSAQSHNSHFVWTPPKVEGR